MIDVEPPEELFSEFTQLRLERSRVDDEIIEWASRVTDEFLTSTFVRSGKQDSPTSLWVVQMFNHQTHHRSQILRLLSQQGVDIGATDLPAMT